MRYPNLSAWGVSADLERLPGGRRNTVFRTIGHRDRFGGSNRRGVRLKRSHGCCLFRKARVNAVLSFLRFYTRVMDGFRMPGGRASSFAPGIL